MVMRPAVLVILTCCSLVHAQHAPKLIDAHLHYSRDPAFLKQLLAKLDEVDGLAFLLVDPKDFGGVKDSVKQHSNRLVGFGEIQLDNPKVVEQIDQFHAAGFRGLGELSGPKKNY